MRTAYEDWYFSRTPQLKSRIVQGNTLRILAAIMKARQDQTPPPTVRELCELTGTTLANIGGHLSRLERLGLIGRQVNKARTLVPTCRFVPAREV